MISANVEFDMSPLEEQLCVFNIFEISAIFKIAAKTRYKKWALKIQNCPRVAPLMVTYHHVKFYVSFIIHLEVININVRNFKFPIGFYSNPQKYGFNKVVSLPQRGMDI
jgi:hypothetical protein